MWKFLLISVSIGIISSSNAELALLDVSSLLDERIVGGSPVDIRERPFQVSIKTGQSLCGGAIIGPSWIITAAHCTQ